MTTAPRPATVAGVVVLFHPGETVLEVARAARPHLTRLYVVDNTPAGSGIGGDLGSQPATELLASGENLGLGIAYNLAARAASRAGAEWLLVLDQDTLLDPAFTEVIATRLAEFGRDPSGLAVVGPRYIHPREPERYGPGPLPAVLVPSIISSGSLVNLAAWQAVGGFDESYFIDYVDVEYSLRAARAGFPSVQVGDQLMTHDMGDAVAHTVLGYTRASSNYPPLRHYYMTRNAVRTGRTVGDGRWRRAELLIRAKVTLLSVVMEPGRWRIVRAIAWGLADGWRGVGGPLPEARRRRLAQSRS